VKRILKIVAIGILSLGLFATRASAQNTINYILRSPTPAQAQAACQTYGLTMVRTIHAPDTYLVQASGGVEPHTLVRWTQGDPNVAHIQQAGKLAVPENPAPPAPLPGTLAAPAPPVAPSLAAVAAPASPNSATLSGPLANLYGSSVWSAYVQQPALTSINASSVIQPNQSGSGIVAVIDTGVDPTNVVLAPVLVPGYDFTQNVAGSASELGDVSQSTAHILFQSTAHILFGTQAMTVNPAASALLDSGTATAMQGVSLPNDFGHGTMVAGLIHLVAPTARIMPLKAFAADGSADESDVIAAIYYATDHGASVINMSFGFPQISDALMKAVNYAARKGVICVAAVGNNSHNALVYPAAFANVIGVASVNSQNQTSSFSNYGPDMVTIAAPGEALITTYPGNHYAAVWGTSFSAALVSGSVDLLIQSAKADLSSQLQVADYARAFRHSNPCATDGSLGAGCEDLNQASKFIQSMKMQAAPPTPGSH
jgi:Subtilase family